MQLHSLDFCVAELFFRLSAPNTEELKQRLPSYAPFYIRQIPEHASMIFEARIADADIVVTGEGAMDSLTLLGKAPYGVCGEAAWNGIPTIAFVGSVSDSDSLNEYGFLSVYPTVSGPMPLEEAMKPDVAYANLKRTAMQVFRTLLIRQNN